MGENSLYVTTLCFLFTALVFGSLITFIQAWAITPNIFKSIPYTVIMFSIGFIIGVSTISADITNTFIDSTDVWNRFDPQLILYIFIPALIFAEVANLNPYHLKTTILQGILLAGPGALVGSLLLGFFLTICMMLPYPLEGWSVNTVYLFAAILCATDPVSVISLLSTMELFRSQKLKYIITSEALFNDAMALCLYTIFLSGELIESTFMSPYEIFIYALRVTFISPAVGCAFGIAALGFCLQVSSDDKNEAFNIIRIIIPICAAYLSFFVGNFVLGDSGILSCYCTGLMFAILYPSFFKDNEEVHSVWVALEWTANTFLFMIAGMVIGYRSLVFFNGPDIANIVVIFLLIQIIRVIMVAALYPMLMVMGRGCNINEALFISFSGLRGAICISLALSFSFAAEAGLTKISAFEGQRFLFYVGFVAFLTLMFNATFAETVLKYLGLSENTTSSPSVEVMRHYTRKRLIEAAIPGWLEVPRMHRKLIISVCQLLKEVDLYNETRQDAAHSGAPLDSHPSSQATSSQQLHNDEPSLKPKPEPESPVSASIALTHGLSQSTTVTFESSSTLAAAASTRSTEATAAAVSEPPPSTALHRAQITSTKRRKAEMEQASKQHARILQYATDTSAMHPDAVPDSELMESVRNAFLQNVRAYYWTRVHKGILDRHSTVVRALLASVDNGLETINTPGLQDWIDVEKSIEANNHFYELPIIKPIYKYLQSHFKRVAQFENRRLEHNSDILHTFISAHKHAQCTIAYYFGETPFPDTIEESTVVLESQELIQLATKRLAKTEDTLLEYRKSKEKALQILALFELMLAECKEEAILMSSDLHHFHEAIIQDRMNLEKLFSRKYKKLKRLESIVAQADAEYINKHLAKDLMEEDDHHDDDEDDHQESQTKNDGQSSLLEEQKHDEKTYRNKGSTSVRGLFDPVVDDDANNVKELGGEPLATTIAGGGGGGSLFSSRLTRTGLHRAISIIGLAAINIGVEDEEKDKDKEKSLFFLSSDNNAHHRDRMNDSFDVFPTLSGQPSDLDLAAGGDAHNFDI